MSRQDILDLLGADWDRMMDLARGQLHSDVRLLDETNGQVVAHSGKLLRPMISLLVAKAIAEPNADSVRYAAASELFHDATLMHDDVADGSCERRGRPTVSALLGPSAAVLVGDYWLARAVDLIVDSGHSREAIRMFSRTLTDLAEGELFQMEKAGSCDTTEEDYLRIIHCKTASLFCAAAGTAALSVDAPPALREAARDFAAAFGAAFQIQDDILDYAGSAGLGKPVGVDLREGKITLPLLGALSGSPREAEIRGMVRQIQDHPEYLDRIRSFVAERDGIGYAARRLAEWAARAEQALSAFQPSPARDALVEITHYTVRRQV